MSYEVEGFDLPKNTLVYYYVGTKPTLTRINGYTNIRIFKFIFDSYDGLYATANARKFWKLHPETHPHATLFIMLYKKLEIGNI